MEYNITNIKTDVLIIGSGGAGLRCAIELKDNNIDVLVVGKCEKRDAHTIMATGGINAALANMDKKDSWQLHASDTIKDGGYINDTKGVITLCKNAPDAVKELEKWGTKFHKEKDGKISQRFFGAATYRRACFVGDHTGREILSVLVNQTFKRKIKFKSMIYIFSLLSKNNNINGAIGLDIKTGKIIVFHSKIIVLATGGHSRIYRRSSSRFWENTGDGIALAFEQNAKFMDMEMFQFHPTGMLWPEEASGLLVTEAVRGEGGILYNNKKERFMKKYDLKRMELSARDIVARAIYNEIEKGHGTKRGGVLLDISHVSKDHIIKRLPQIYTQFKKFENIDITKKPMEVAPTAHYSMGGIYVNHNTGKTSLKNLYAIGEVTAGIHGGNRLGGNSLAEITVFGKLTGKNIAKEVSKMKLIDLDKKEIKRKIDNFIKFTSSKKGIDPIKAKKEIQEIMWHNVGVVRNEKNMKKALKLLKKYNNTNFKINTGLKMNKSLIAALDIKNILPTCNMVIKSAIFRKESRSAHYRSDYPKTIKSWQKNIICIRDKKSVKLKTKKVSPVPKNIKKLFDYHREAHLLE